MGQQRDFTDRKIEEHARLLAELARVSCVVQVKTAVSKLRSSIGSSSASRQFKSTGKLKLLSFCRAMLGSCGEAPDATRSGKRQPEAEMLSK